MGRVRTRSTGAVAVCAAVARVVAVAGPRVWLVGVVERGRLVHDEGAREVAGEGEPVVRVHRAPARLQEVGDAARAGEGVEGPGTADVGERLVEPRQEPLLRAHVAQRRVRQGVGRVEAGRGGHAFDEERTRTAGAQPARPAS